MNSDMPPITRGSSVLRPAMFALSIGACLCGCQLDLNAVGNPEHAPNLASLSVVAEATADAGRPETVDRDLHQAVIDDFVQQYETMNATDLIGQCVHARMIAAAYRQAHRPGQYAEWKQTAYHHCPH
jgi:hypothetical protein